MAEAFGIVAGTLTVLEITTKIIQQCKALIETANDAPRDLRHVLIEMSSLKAILESFDFLSTTDFSDSTQSLADYNGVVEGCRGTVEELSKELDGLSLAGPSDINVAPGKRRRIKQSFQWCLKEGKTRKLLDEAMQHKTTLTLALLGEITTDVKEIKRTITQVHDRHTAADRRKMCDWIEQINPTLIHEQSCQRHEKRTCEWVHRVDQWNDWLHRQRRLLWIHGIPGAGKTVLASYLIQQTITYCESQLSEQTACLYYYCSFRHGQEERRDESLPFLRWVVSQLCRRTDHVPPEMISLYRQNSIPSSQPLMDALSKLLAHFQVLYIVIDAVDESNPRDDLLRLIQTITSHPKYAKIQLLVTSRRYADIEEILRPLSEPTLPMSNSVVDVDIRAYIDTTIQQSKCFSKWSSELQKDIVETLAQGAQGMFRWVVCQIDRLQRKSPKQARQALKCLPRTIEDTYETILLEIPRDDWPAARSALYWISGHSNLHFSRGIPAACLSAAVLNTDYDPEFDTGDHDHDHEFLKAILGCLIEVDFVDENQFREDGNILDGIHTISLAHYTIEEYLFSNRVKTSGVSYFSMSQDACAEKILDFVLSRIPKNQCTFGKCGGCDQFVRYCWSIARWFPAVWSSILLRDDTLWARYHDYFDKNAYSWQDLDHEDDMEDMDDMRCPPIWSYDNTVDPMSMESQYLMAILDFGCVGMTKKLLDELPLEAILSVSIPLQKTTWGTSDVVATDKLGHVTILDALGSACSCFSCERYEKLFESLKSTMEPPTLFWFCLGAHYHEYTCDDDFCIIVDLLEAGANANVYDCLLTPLQISVRNWDYAGTETLLEHGADPNGVGKPGGYIPTHIDTTWAQSSPLHILRNAEYGFMAMECSVGLKAIRAKKRPDIEALLLKYGADDFTT
ncbi:hypothetical protein BKA66DRAFT_550433 [Pyrenochaeta sp. MPI-SDFR-AT-0127]|nr:hypothetical protein BKA66DRAFT_550433 [Pyrenochaeta sp. MPI-SDFR-AT-0127]